MSQFSPMAEPVTVVKQGAVTTVILNRPEHKNAVNGPTARALEAAFKAFDEDESQRVAVLYGAGGVFCAGADLKAISSGSESNPMLPVGDGAIGPMGPSRMLLSKPVIAAISGFAVAGGLELACWCDMRVAEESATFGVFCRRWGVPLIDGGTVRLPRLIGHSRALDMILTGRAVSAKEALDWGLANRVVPDGQARAAAEKLAQELAQLPQQCMRNDRRSSYEQWGLTLDKALEAEFNGGMDAVMKEGISGASRFAKGAGRHGATATEGGSDQHSSARGESKSAAAGGAVRAVLFDIGGVVCGSPLEAILKYEQKHGLPKHALARVFVKSQAFEKLESGQYAINDFIKPFEAECAKAGWKVDGKQLFSDMEAAAMPRPAFVSTIKRLRELGYKTAAITNNWKQRLSDERSEAARFLDAMFDQVVESCVIGIRKPDPRIFELTCQRLGVAPSDCVFLDDIGSNLSAARKLGMQTIKVSPADEGAAALRDLEAALGRDLALGQSAAGSSGGKQPARSVRSKL